MASPLGPWHGSAVPLSLVVALLQGCEGVLRRSGQHHSGDQLHQLLTRFLDRQRQHTMRIDQADARPPLQPSAPPPAPEPALPARASRPRRRRPVPGLGLLSDAI